MRPPHNKLRFQIFGTPQGHTSDNCVYGTELRPSDSQITTKHQGFAYRLKCLNLLHSKDVTIFTDSLNTAPQVQVPESRIRVNKAWIFWEYLQIFTVVSAIECNFTGVFPYGIVFIFLNVVLIKSWRRGSPILACTCYILLRGPRNDSSLSIHHVTPEVKCTHYGNIT